MVFYSGVSMNGVQNFNPQTVSGKVELLFETPTKMTFTSFSTDGKKTAELILNAFRAIK